MKKILIALSLALFFTPSFAGKPKAKKPKPVPAFSAKSFLIADSDGSILREQRGDTVRPIASISKLMVALLSADQDLDEMLSIPEKRIVTSSIPRKTEQVSRRELLTLALVRSDNLAAQILCDNLPNCVQAMNEKAAELGMHHTHFNEPTGLDRGNVSTAQDLLKLMLVSGANPVISELSSLPDAEFDLNGKTVRVHNTNPLTSRMNVRLSKTGYTSPAGGCLVMMTETLIGKRFYIILGSRNAKTRIPDMERLVREQ